MDKFKVPLVVAACIQLLMQSAHVAYRDELPSHLYCAWDVLCYTHAVTRPFFPSLFSIGAPTSVSSVGSQDC